MTATGAGVCPPVSGTRSVSAADVLPGSVAEALIQLLVERHELLAVVPLRRQRQLRGEDALRLEARLHPLQAREAGEQQTCGDEQHERQRHFGHQQARAKTMARSDRAAARFLERLQHVDARRLPRGQQTDRQPGDERHDQREAQRERIDPDLEDARNQLGAEGDQRARAPTPPAAGRRAPPSTATSMLSVTSWRTTSPRLGAEREARGDLPPPAGEARQQQIGDVRAGDQEHAAHGAEEQQIALPLIADGIVEERHDLDLRRRVDVGRDSPAR